MTYIWDGKTIRGLEALLVEARRRHPGTVSVERQPGEMRIHGVDEVFVYWAELHGLDLLFIEPAPARSFPA